MEPWGDFLKILETDLDIYYLILVSKPTKKLTDGLIEQFGKGVHILVWVEDHVAMYFFLKGMIVS